MEQYNATSMLNATDTDDQPVNLNTICSKCNCFFCGGSHFNCQQCSVKDAIYDHCQKKVYFAKVYQSKFKQSTTKTTVSAYSKLACIRATLKSIPSLYAKTIVSVYVNNQSAEALIGTASSNSLIFQILVQ